MEKVFRAILNHKKTVVVLFAAALAASYFLSKTVVVNYDLMDYLPDDAPSTIALGVMKDEYGGEIPSARVMIPEVTLQRALEIKSEISAVDGVTDVTWLDDEANLDIPLEVLDQDTVDNYYKDGCALYTVTLDGAKRIGALNAIREIIGDQGAMTGSAVNTAVATETTGSDVQKIVLIAVPICFAILILTTNSWIEPVLLMLAIGVAIMLNRGTNAILGEISFISNAAGSILQLAVSMDYSIFLLNRFSESRKQGLPVQEAMLNALKKSFSPIVSGGFTAFTGFAVLAIMRFKIGPDMGIVLAKGIVLSIISVLTLMPVLFMYSGKLIAKTQHRPLVPTFKRFGGFVSKVKAPVLILFVLLIVPCYLAQSSNGFYYGSSRIFDENTRVGEETAEIEHVFGKANTLVLMVPNGDRAKEAELSDALHAIPQVSGILSYVDTVGAEVPEEYLDGGTLSKLISKNYSRFILTVETDYEGTKAFDVVKQIESAAAGYYGDKYLFAGESVNTYDLMNVVKTDKGRVEIAAIAAIFIILLLTFKSASLPVILVAVIKSAIWLNLSVPYFQDSYVFYIAYLIVDSIQLGSTIDYAILLNDRYMEERRHHTKKEALLIMSRNTTLPVLTSASILTLGGLSIGMVSQHGVLRQLGILIGRGTVLSTVLVLLVLPAMFYFFDRVIQKTSKGVTFYRETEHVELGTEEREYSI